MPVLDMVKYGDPVLSSPCAVVDDFGPALAQLALDMEDTMLASNGGGIAANQVGEPLRLFVMKPGAAERERSAISAARLTARGSLVVVNPVITREAGMQVGQDGCLSFPGLKLTTVRPSLIELTAQSLDGSAFSLSFGVDRTSLRPAQTEEDRVSRDAMVASHEIDHLDGTPAHCQRVWLLVDR